MILLRKILLFTMFTMSVFLLAACGGTQNVTDYVEVSFSGMDTKGTADYEVNETALIEEIFNLDEVAQDFPSDEVAIEAYEILGAYSIKMEPSDNLSNGDKVKIIVTVDEKVTKQIKSGEKEFTVEGLEEPKELTTEEVEKNLVLNFNGVSGRGFAQIDKIFDEPLLNDIDYQIENDGKLENGEKAKVILDKDAENQLNANGYVLEKDFNPTVEVKNLDAVAEKATDIANLEDLERFLGEEFSSKYEDTDYSFGSNTKYEVTQEKLLYRQFDKKSSGDDADYYYEDMKNGNLISIYSVKKYRVEGEEKKLDTEFTAVYGYSGLLLDEENKVNLSELKKIDERKEKNYSVESVIQLYEGEGYVEVEK